VKAAITPGTPLTAEVSVVRMAPAEWSRTV
jgi:hypothetical protein